MQTGLRGTQETRWLPYLLWWSEPYQLDTSPLVGNMPGCLEPETGSVSEALLLLPVPEAVLLLQSAHSPFTVCELTCTDWSLRDPGPKMALSPAQAEPSPVDTSPLSGKVPGCLEPKTGSASEAVL